MVLFAQYSLIYLTQTWAHFKEAKIRCLCRQELESTDQLSLDSWFSIHQATSFASTFIFMILFCCPEMMARSDQVFSLCSAEVMDSEQQSEIPVWEDRLCFDRFFILEFAQRFKKIQAVLENNPLLLFQKPILSLWKCIPILITEY